MLKATLATTLRSDIAFSWCSDIACSWCEIAQRLRWRGSTSRRRVDSRWCQTISLTKLDTILSIPAGPGRAALERHQSVKSCIRGEAIRLAGLAFKWPQGQTYTRHYRIPSTLFLLRIGEIKAVDGPAQTGRKVAAAVKNDPFSLRGDGEERPGYPHIVQSS